ncbi:MAG: hypothetical protein RLN76_03275 [Phycisphaeraceae bacterium]
MTTYTNRRIDQSNNNTSGKIIYAKQAEVLNLPRALKRKPEFRVRVEFNGLNSISVWALAG